MTRRDFILTAAAVLPGTPGLVSVPVHRITDSKAQFPPEELHRFWSSIWPEAVVDFSRGGIELQTSDGPGEVGHSAADKPLIGGLRRGVVNLVLTDHLPLYWDNGRALSGVTTLYHGYHVCMIALRYAHGNRAPFLSVNTCVHELLHALLQDIFITRPTWLRTGTRENRADWYATCLWLFHDGAAVRRSARTYLDRLRSGNAAAAAQ
jgi:hypothetical protein